jgi:hypothetical protein
MDQSIPTNLRYTPFPGVIWSSAPGVPSLLMRLWGGSR